MHKVVARQLKRYLNNVEMTPDFARFVQAVSDSYTHYDDHLQMTSRSLELCSDELNQMNERLHDEVETVRLQKKQLEQVRQDLLAVNQELKEFAYVVSHDLKAPLRAIGSLANWIREDYAKVLDEDGKDNLELLVQRVMRMQNLIDGILQYSRMARVREEVVAVDLDAEIPQIVDSLSPPPHIKVELLRPFPTVLAERTRLAQTFQNLLSNAIKHMEKPQGRITIGHVDSGDMWTFSVTDTGPGIEERFFKKIFNIFQTLKPRDECESTGIGLTVVKKVVELHGGRVWLESEVGRGTTFHFTLPKRPKQLEGDGIKRDAAEQVDLVGGR